MKKWIHAREQHESSILEGIDEISVIVVVNDARSQGLQNLPVKASSGADEDYDQFSIEELMNLDKSTLRNIHTFYALDNLSTAIKEYGFDYKLTTKQETELSDYYKKRELAQVQLTDEDIDRVLELIHKCKHITGPDYRINQPEKNFAEMHGLDMTPSDYLAIIKNLKREEFFEAVKSFDTKRLGSVLYEFIHHPNGYTLKYSGQEIKEDIKIYIKLLPDYQRDSSIIIVSFHDPED